MVGPSSPWPISFNSHKNRYELLYVIISMQHDKTELFSCILLRKKTVDVLVRFLLFIRIFENCCELWYQCSIITHNKSHVLLWELQNIHIHARFSNIHKNAWKTLSDNDYFVLWNPCAFTRQNTHRFLKCTILFSRIVHLRKESVFYLVKSM